MFPVLIALALPPAAVKPQNPVSDGGETACDHAVRERDDRLLVVLSAERVVGVVTHVRGVGRRADRGDGECGEIRRVQL